MGNKEKGLAFDRKIYRYHKHDTNYRKQCDHNSQYLI